MDKVTLRIYRKTGLFVALAILVMLFLIIFIAQRQRFFSRKHTFYTVFEDAVGLEKTSPIMFKGTEIGRVRDYYFDEQRNIKVRFHIFSEHRELIVENSAISKTPNPLGGRASIDFLMGPTEGYLKEELSVVPSLDFETGRRLLAERKVRTRGDQLSAIVANLGTFVENLNRDDNYDQGSVFRMLYHLAYVAENLNSSLVNMNNIMVSLQKDHNESEGALFRLTVNLADLTEEFRVSNSLVAQNLMNFDQLIRNYGDPENLIVKMLDPTEENIFTPLNQSLNAMAKNLESISNIIEFFDHQTPEIAIIMSETNKTLSELQKTLQGINNNPLLRRGIKREELPISGERIRLMDGEQ